MNLAQRLDAALTRRLYPNSPLSPKQLAHALGVDCSALWRWRNGRRAITAETMLALIGFFRSRGDVAFEAEMMSAAREVADYFRRHVIIKPWHAERLSLDSALHSGAERLIAISNSSDLLAAAENAGIIGDLSLFRIDGEVVTNLQIGKSSQMPLEMKKDMVGRDLDAWPDVAYRMMVKEHILDSVRTGTSYHYLDGDLHGIHAPYRRVLAVVPPFAASHTERLVA